MLLDFEARHRVLLGSLEGYPLDSEVSWKLKKGAYMVEAATEIRQTAIVQLMTGHNWAIGQEGLGERE